MSLKPSQVYRLRVLTDRYVQAKVAEAFAGTHPPAEANELYADAVMAKRSLYNYIRKLRKIDEETDT